MLTPTTISMLLFLISHASADFCNSDPRVSVSVRNCSSPHTLLHLPNIDANPNHALHDKLWAVSHYLSQCISSPLTINMTLRPYNHTLCLEDGTILRWAHCVIHAMTNRINAALTNTPNGCFSSELRLGVNPSGFQVGAAKRGDFRGMSWLGCEKCEKTDPLIPLSDKAKTDALVNLRDAVLEMVGALARENDGRVHILLYDRNDTTRRQWVNAHEVYERLKLDKRVELNYVRQMPTGFKSQVLLYAWTDIVIAPHGAAMVNTVFMRNGSEVIEIWKHCDENVVGNPFQPRDWTGWHANLLGLQLRYVQCHRAELKFKNESELEERGHGVDTNGRHKVRVDEVLEAVEQAVIRQSKNLVSQTEEVKHSQGRGEEGVLFVVDTDEQYDMPRRVFTFILMPSCAFIFVVWTLLPRSMSKLRRNHLEELQR